MKRSIAVLFVGCLALPAAAIAPDATMRPLARGEVAAPVLTRPKLRPSVKALESLKAALPHRPKLRPVSEQEEAMGRDVQINLASAAVSLPNSLNPY